MVERAMILVAVFGLIGCAANSGLEALSDPLRERLLTRERLAMDNMLAQRSPGYFLPPDDQPFYGPTVEPPLPEPDLNLVPEAMPLWDESETPVEPITPAP